MLEKYKQKQPEFYNYFIKAKEHQRLAHAYLLETNGINYSKELATDLAKFLLCNDKDSEIINQIDSGNFPDLYIIDPETVIKKEQILDLQNRFSTKPIYSDKLVYIITNAALLNASSANTILKFLEEPEEGIIAILLVDDVSQVLETISSRCQIISIKNSEGIDNVYGSFTDEEKEVFIKDVIEYIDLFEKNNKAFICSKTSYKFNENIELFLYVVLNIYIDVLRNKTNRDNKYFKKVDFSNTYIMKNNETRDIINKINIINKFINNVKYNVNKDLYIDNLLITLMGGSND